MPDRLYAVHNRLHEEKAVAAWRKTNPDGWSRVVSLLLRGHVDMAQRLALALYGPEAVGDLQAMEDIHDRISYPGRWIRPPLTRWGERPASRVTVRCRACGGWGVVHAPDGPPLNLGSCSVCGGAGVLDIAEV